MAKQNVPIELMELLHNLKDHDFDVDIHYKMDENESNKIIKAIEEELINNGK